MKTTDIFSMVYGEDANSGFSTRLADIQDRLVEQHEARERQRLAEGDIRDALAGQGPMIGLLQREFTAAQNEALVNSQLPAAMTFDAYCLVKDASNERPEDRGLKQAAHLLYDRWNQDPMGHLTVGELTELRDHYADVFPKSAVRQVLDTDIPEKCGFQTLSNLPYLNRIASQVVDQDSYERLVEANGLDGDRPEQIRARAYIKGLAELGLTDERFELDQQPTVQQAIDRAISRFAQEELEVMPEEPGDAGEDGAFGGEEFGESPQEEAFEHEQEEQAIAPHDEESEELATIESPVTGEPLVLELGAKEDGVDMDVDEPPMGGQEQPSNMSLPNAFGEVTAQMYDQPPMGGGAGAATDEAGGIDGGGFVEDETMTTIVDPTSGQELQVTLSPIEEEGTGEFGGEEKPGISMNDMDEMGGNPDGMGELEVEGGMDAEGSAPEGWEGTVKHMKRKPGIDNEYALANWMKNKGYEPHYSDSGKHKAGRTAESFESLMNTKVPQQPNQHEQPGESWADTDITSESMPSSGPGPKPKSKATPGKKAKLSRERVAELCAGMGITASSIESGLLDGNEIAVGAYAIRIGGDDSVELRRLAAEGTTDGAKLIRSSSMSQFDAAVGDFMALAAAQVVVPEAATKTAARVAPKAGSYVLTSDVPSASPMVARRMMASVWKVVPDAEGELLDDGRLAVLIRTAEARDMNRIQRVLADVFGAANIETRKVAQMTNSSVPSVQPQLQQAPLASQSPFIGRTPTQMQPAGTPAQPQTAPQQTAATGSGAQQAFMAQHTDPLDVSAESEHEANETLGYGDAPIGESHDSGMGMTAQLDDEVPVDDEEVVDEELPVEDEEALVDGEVPPEAAGDGIAGPVAPPMPPVDMGPGGVPGMGMPGMPGAPGMGMGDASQMPLDINQGQLQPEDEEAVHAAMTHFRNMGMLPLEAIDKFVSAYKGMLDKYGDESSIERGMAEAGVIKTMTEAFNRPAVVPAKAASIRQASISGENFEVVSRLHNLFLRQAKTAFEAPKPVAQHPGKVKVKKNFGDKPGDFPTPKAPKPQSGSQTKQPGETWASPAMQGNTGSHDWGNIQVQTSPQQGSQHPQKGESWSNTDMGKGTKGTGENGFTRKMDEVSRGEKMRSTKRGDLLIEFDPQLGDFTLSRDNKKLATHMSLTDAMADAERRKMANLDSRILIADGEGGYENAETGEMVTE